MVPLQYRKPRYCRMNDGDHPWGYGVEVLVSDIIKLLMCALCNLIFRGMVDIYKICDGQKIYLSTETWTKWTLPGSPVITVRIQRRTLSIDSAYITKHSTLCIRRATVSVCPYSRMITHGISFLLYISVRVKYRRALMLFFRVRCRVHWDRYCWYWLFSFRRTLRSEKSTMSGRKVKSICTAIDLYGETSICRIATVRTPNDGSQWV